MTVCVRGGVIASVGRGVIACELGEGGHCVFVRGTLLCSCVWCLSRRGWIVGGCMRFYVC